MFFPSLQAQHKNQKGDIHVTSAENNGTAEKKRANAHTQDISTTTITTMGGGVDMLRTFLSELCCAQSILLTRLGCVCVCDDADDGSDSLAYSSLLSVLPPCKKKKKKPCCEEMNLVYQNYGKIQKDKKENKKSGAGLGIAPAHDTTRGPVAEISYSLVCLFFLFPSVQWKIVGEGVMNCPRFFEYKPTESEQRRRRVYISDRCCWERLLK